MARPTVADRDKRSSGRVARAVLLVVAVVTLVVVASSCSSGPDIIGGPLDTFGPLPTAPATSGPAAAATVPPASEDRASGVGAPAGSSTTVPATVTTQPRNERPQILGPQELVAEVGAMERVRLTVTDPDGPAPEVSIEGRPDGLDVRKDAGGLDLIWRPTEPGRWEVRVIAIDDERSRSEFIVYFEARHRATEIVMGMGDSVAAGHGRDLSDYLGDDDCWRDHGAAYGRIVRDGLVERGELREGAGLVLVACSGFATGNMDRNLITPGPAGIGEVPGVDSLTQMGWAARFNPAVITLSIGANNLRFVEPWQLIEGDGELRQDGLDGILYEYGNDLAEILATLLATTDATIVVTNYYDPSAANPQGFGTCRGACFKNAVNEALDQANATIARVVAAAAQTNGDRGRVVLADIREVFVGHGAPNGFGPDGWREDAFGALGVELGAQELEGVHPYCAIGDTVGTTWISRVDCVHPNEAGQAAIAAVVLDALDRA